MDDLWIYASPLQSEGLRNGDEGHEDRDSDMSIAMAPEERRLFLVGRHYKRLMLVARIANCEAVPARRIENPVVSMPAYCDG